MFENEAPKELELGKEYSEKQLYDFILSNGEVMILCDETKKFNKNGKSLYKIEQVLNTYIHSGEPKLNSSYHEPGPKTKIYRIMQIT